MKTKILFFLIAVAVLITACNSDNKTKSGDVNVPEKQEISKQFYVSFEHDGETVIMQSNDVSCGYAYTNSTGVYNVDMSYEFAREGDVLKQVNFGFYIEDKTWLNAEGLVGKSFPVRLNIFHRDLGGNNTAPYQRSTDFADNQASSCTFESFEQIGDSRYFLAKGKFHCVLSNMEETETLDVKDGVFAMKIKP